MVIRQELHTYNVLNYENFEFDFDQTFNLN